MIKYTVGEIEEKLKEKDLVIKSNTTHCKNKLISNLTDNSKEVKANTLFICKGAHFKKEYLLDAMDKGTICYITDNENLLGFGEYIYVSDIRKAMAVTANIFYNFAWKKLKLIGITGTKGKSTTAYMLKTILAEHLSGSDKKCGILSSIQNFDGSAEEESRLTTQEPLDLHKSFAEMVKNNCEYCVMEVSSQALKYDRVSGIQFDIGVFLNIGEDHISDIEHSSFEDYFLSKKQLISQSNLMIMSDELDIQSDKALYFGLKPVGKYTVKNIQLGEEFNSFSLDKLGDFKISIRGDFNILNAAAAIAVSNELHIGSDIIQAGLLKTRVSGRMEVFKSKNSSNIAIVDYAHNKLSYEALFSSVLKEYTGHKIVTVFGCPGNKAYQRRLELPQIAEKYSDYIFITEEDHGEESLSKINSEILANIQDKAKAEIVGDREEAVMRALKKYDENTVILILGKGRETRQKRGNDYICTESDVNLVKKFWEEI